MYTYDEPKAAEATKAADEPKLGRKRASVAAMLPRRRLKGKGHKRPDMPLTICVRSAKRPFVFVLQKTHPSDCWRVWLFRWPWNCRPVEAVKLIGKLLAMGFQPKLYIQAARVASHVV